MGEEEHLHVDLEGGCQKGAGAPQGPAHSQVCTPTPSPWRGWDRRAPVAAVGLRSALGGSHSAPTLKCELGLWAEWAWEGTGWLKAGRVGPGAWLSRGRPGPHLHQCRGGLSWGSQYPLP